MLTAAGNINQDYEVIGIVHATASRVPEKAGCGSPAGIAIEAAYRDVTGSLQEAAARSGGDALIHVGYDYRMSTQQMGCNGVQPSFEVYAWGTAVKLR
ncbi:hypothetical protein ACFQ1E_06285 [Sphingomonas canadensis]|uniref:Heavy metal-binding domain-containing protein n=1 Tax=Sphingomonas canadensis TaxID=1219257 RepID=A0ABW3H392_9SPHN|nr:hypothetical protein [Sphingomonas canadensis]MCW3835602.1 hypothetical protein [Sphingomonas canadensis]